MNETDDRLAGDLVWELFAAPIHHSADDISRVRRYSRRLAWVGLIVAVWFLSAPTAVVVACLLVAAGDFRKGRHLARSIPDKAGGTICSRFTYAWGAWKLGVAAIALMLMTVWLSAAMKKPKVVPPELFALMLLCFGGFTLSAALTASGLVAAWRSGMRVWIGEGVNQASTLLLGMLVVGFAYAILGPTCIWLSGRFPLARDSQTDSPVVFMLAIFGCMLGGGLVIVLVLDFLSLRIVADRPGKFGPKVPTVGKWNA